MKVAICTTTFIIVAILLISIIDSFLTQKSIGNTCEKLCGDNEVVLCGKHLAHKPLTQTAAYIAVCHTTDGFIVVSSDEIKKDGY